MARQLFAQLSKDSFTYGLSAAVAKLVGFVLVPIYTRLLSPGDYGLLNLIVTITSILTSLLILGLDAAAALRFYKTADTEERRVITSTFLYFELGLVIIVSVMLFAAARPLAQLLFNDAAFTPYLQLTLLTVPFANLVTLFLMVTRLVRQPVRYLAISIANLVITSGSIVFALALGAGLGGVLAATLLGSIATSLGGWWLSRPQYRRVFSFALLRRLLALGLPLVPATLAYWVISFSNLWFLQYMASTQDVAVLALATRLVAPVVLAVTAFQIAWGPFALSIAQNDAAESVYARTLMYFLALTFGVLLLLTLFAEPLILIFSTPAYLPASQVLALVGISSIASGVYYIVATGVNLAEKTGHIGWTTVVGALVNIMLNLLLIPVWGVVGAALAGVLANVTLVGLLYRASQRLTPIPYDLPRALLLTVVAASCLMAVTVLHLSFPILDFALRVLLVGVFVAALGLLGVVRGSDLRMLRAMLRNRVGKGAGA